MSTPEHDALRVLAHLRQAEEALAERQVEHSAALDKAITESEALLTGLGEALPERSTAPGILREPPALREWSDILAEAQASHPDTVDFSTVLSDLEIEGVAAWHARMEAEFSSLHSLDTCDWIVAGAAGVLAALADIFLVQVPKHPGFLGGAGHDGGWLSNLIKEKYGRLVTEERLQALERAYRVPYDHATSHGLDVKIPGLGPSTHRFQSLGHDPILGWLAGISDLLRGNFTAIGADGRVVVQEVAEPFMPGELVFVRVFEALARVGGHLLSDVGTPRGLPAPLMPLLLLIQKGSIGEKGYTVGDIARQMYRAGYDFRHFTASALPVMLSEAIIRITFFARRIQEGCSLADAVPNASNPRLRRQLFLAHSVATAVNAGKVYVTQNPLSVNWAQWLALFRYLLPQMQWLLFQKERGRAELVREQLDREWQDLDADFARFWRSTFQGEAAVL